MRTLTIPLLMAALSATASEPGKMLVVVHTSDMVIVNYVCSNTTDNTADNPVLGSMIKSTGGYNWHVVGGVAPYTIVRNEMRTMAGGCITVMDAEGTVATGCGVIGVHQEQLQVDCNAKRDLDDGTFGLVPNDSTDAARSAWKKPPVTHDPRDTYVPPVRGPLPHVAPPVDPKPPISVKPEGRTPAPSPRPNNPPPVNHRDVAPVVKSPDGGMGHGPRSLGQQPSGTSGNGASQQHVSNSSKVQ